MPESCSMLPLALEDAPFREDHSRTTDSYDDSTASSNSIIPGPGALTARFLKWFGNTSLDSLQRLCILRRLSVIKSVVRKRPDIFTDPLSSDDMRKAERAYDDLQELCSGRYPCAIQRKAARLILAIAFHCSGGAVTPEDSGRDRWNRWTRLLGLSRTLLLGRSEALNGADVIRRVDVGLSSTATSATAFTFGTIKPSLSSLTLISLGSIKQSAIKRVGAHKNLSSIRRAVRNKPYIFTSSQGLHQTQEVDSIFKELTHLMRLDHPLHTRQKAARLVLEITFMVSGPSVVSCPISLEGSELVRPLRLPWEELISTSDVVALLVPRIRPAPYFVI